MINYYSSLTQEEKILLYKIVELNKKCEMEIGLDVLSSVRQEFVLEYLDTAIQKQLTPQGAEMATTILQKLLGTYIDPELKNLIKIEKPKKKLNSKKIDSLV